MNSQTACRNMVSQQLRTGDISDQTILNLYTDIPREDFVPQAFKDFAYSDMQIQLPHQQRMMTPLEEAKILQSLELNGHEVILEVGTGSGYLTALLSRLCKKVISIDYFQDFSEHARRKLAEHNCPNVEIFTGDACQGWMDTAPYDVIVFTGSQESLTESHRLQLLPGGKLFALIGKEPVMQGQLHTLDHHHVWSNQCVFETNIPPLIDRLKPNDFVF